MKNISIQKKIGIVLASLATILLAVYSAPITVGATARIVPVEQIVTRPSQGDMTVYQDPIPKNDPIPGSEFPYQNNGFRGGWGMQGSWGMPRSRQGMRSGWGMGYHNRGMMGGTWRSCCGSSGYSIDSPLDDDADVPEEVSFATDIQPVFNQRCVACHGGAGGLSLGSYEEVMNGGNNGLVIIPGNPASSRLVQYVNSGYMPYGGPPLPASQVQTIVNWVATGALDN